MNLLPDTALARTWFRRIHDATRDAAGGVMRVAYREGERIAYALVCEAAEATVLTTRTDPAGNLYARLPGRDARMKRLVFGSHLDSVPQGRMRELARAESIRRSRCEAGP